MDFSILPRELQFMVYRKMDIDTRRKCNIYIRLKLSIQLKTMLEGIVKPVQFDLNNSVVCLNGKYKIMRYFDESSQLIDERISFLDKRFYMTWSILSSDV